MKRKKRILVCPLNWGLGHATRCIPLIRELLKQDADVIIAAEGRPLELLKQEFPNLEYIVLKGYDITYPSSGNMALHIFMQLPRILTGIYREHAALNALIDKYHLDAIISDNRYGLWSRRIPSVFITHQLRIKCPPLIAFLEPVLYRINTFFTKKYTHCWIPDFALAPGLSGDLSHTKNLPANTTFIGPLSRFMPGQQQEKKYDLLILLSGPEPQRTLFEGQVISQLKGKRKVLIVSGTPERKENTSISESIERRPHLAADELQKAILQSEFVICRAGYSTIMDLAVLGKCAGFVPTPGQTEQEYLAILHKQNGAFYFQEQSVFNLEEMLKKGKEYNGIQLQLSPHGIAEKVQELLR